MRESVSATYWDGMGTRPEGDAMGGARVEFGGAQTELQREHGPVASLACCLALLLVGHQQLGQTKARQRLWTETLNRSCSCTISSDAHLTFVKDVPVSPRGNRALCNNKKQTQAFPQMYGRKTKQSLSQVCSARFSHCSRQRLESHVRHVAEGPETPLALDSKQRFSLWRLKPLPEVGCLRV